MKNILKKMPILVLLSFILGVNAHADEYLHLVIDVKNVIFTEVAKHNEQFYGKNLFEFAGTDKKDRGYYIKTPEVETFFEYLLKQPKLKIHVAHTFDSSTVVAQAIKTISFPNAKKTINDISVVAKIKEFNLDYFKSIDPTPSKVFFLTGSKQIIPDEMKAKSWALDTSKLLFLNFADSQLALTELQELPHLLKKLTPRIPKDNQEWRLSRERFNIPTFMLTRWLNKQSIDVQDASASLSVQEAFFTGLSILKGAFVPQRVRWILNASETPQVRCALYDYLENEEVSSLELKSCSNSFYNWSYFYTSHKQDSCALFVKEGDDVFHGPEVDLRNCLNRRVIVFIEQEKRYAIIPGTKKVQDMSAEKALELALNSKQYFSQDQRESFGNLLVTQNSARLNDQVGGVNGDCFLKLKEFYLSGGVLFSETVAKKLVPLSEYAKAVGIDLEFYHYTDAKALYNLLMPNELNREIAHFSLSGSDKGYVSIFRFLKTKGNVSYDALYMAQDDSSSRNYGNIQVEFTLDGNAMVFDDEGNTRSSGFISQVLNEVEGKNPEVMKACSYYRQNLYYFILDDSGADLLDYYNNNLWFKVTNSRIILKSEVRKL